MYSLIIPVYKNEGSIPELLIVLSDLNKQLKNRLEVVFVVDGSPDKCFDLLNEALPKSQFRARLLLLSRNFGSFAAIRAGLAEASGRYFAVMAADLQEPSELIYEFFKALEFEPVDVTIGTRLHRNDPLPSRIASGLFWRTYRSFIQKDIPLNGVDVFGCNIKFRNKLIQLKEINSSLVGQIFWLGFRRKFIPYTRLTRKHGKSAWSFRKKINYLMDSLFSFSDLPVRVMTFVGIIGLLISIGLMLIVLIAKVFNLIPVPGYTATIVAISFFAALNIFCFGILGSYIWRAFENTKGRPESLILINKDFSKE